MNASVIDAMEKHINDGNCVNLAPDGTITVLPQGTARQELAAALHRVEVLQLQLVDLRKLLNTPEVEDFDKAVPLEAAHQVKRWGTEDDAGKTPGDWFWLLGYLAGKVLYACINGDTEKAKHHCISSAAALRNWHAHIRTGQSVMRPGIEPPKE